MIMNISKEELDKEQEKLYNLEQARCWRVVTDPLKKVKGGLALREALVKKRKKSRQYPR